MSALSIDTAPSRQPRPPSIAAFAVDDLARDPCGFAAHEPGDEACDVLGPAPPTGGELRLNPLVERPGGPPGVHRSRVHAVHGDGSIREGISEGGRHLVN